jgi:hypothetical protein
MKQAGHVTCMEEIKNPYKILGVDRRKILKQVLKKDALKMSILRRVLTGHSNSLSNQLLN